MYRTFCILFFIINAVNARAQIFIRTNPLAPADIFDQNVSVGGEYRFNDTWAVTADAAWVFYSLYFQQTKKANGIIFRPAVRAYLGLTRSFFIDLQFHYKYVMYQADDWLKRDVVNNVAAYEEKTLFWCYKQVMGMQVMYGSKIDISRNERLFLEPYLGIGVRFKRQSLYHEPDNTVYARQNTFLDFTNRVHRLPALPMGFRLVYRLR